MQNYIHVYIYMYMYMYIHCTCIHVDVHGCTCTCMYNWCLTCSLGPSPWSGESSNEQEAPPTVPHPLNLDLTVQEDKSVVPSESDVLDILSSAHSTQSQVHVYI